MPPGPCRIGPDPRWVAGLHRRRAVIRQLCSALQDYLCFDIDADLARLSDPPPKSVATPDMLVQATIGRDAIQQQIEALEAFCSEVPDAHAHFMRSTLLPNLKVQLDQAENWCSMIQAELETQSGPPPDPAALADTPTGSETGSQTKGEEA